MLDGRSQGLIIPWSGVQIPPGLFPQCTISSVHDSLSANIGETTTSSSSFHRYAWLGLYGRNLVCFTADMATPPLDFRDIEDGGGEPTEGMLRMPVSASPHRERLYHASLHWISETSKTAAANQRRACSLRSLTKVRAGSKLLPPVDEEPRLLADWKRSPKKCEAGSERGKTSG